MGQINDPIFDNSIWIYSLEEVLGGNKTMRNANLDRMNILVLIDCEFLHWTHRSNDRHKFQAVVDMDCIVYLDNSVHSENLIEK